MKRLTAVVVAITFVAACSSERSSTAGSTGTTSLDSTVPTTDTTPSSTTTEPAPTLAGTTSTTFPCEYEGGTGPVVSQDPLLMSSMVGVDIRAEARQCYERIVIELGGSGDFPGWSVQYVDDPARIGESDDFVEIAGDATLQVIMRMWMPTMEGDGYTGPIDVFPGSVVHILELRETENFEGMCIWSIGLDTKYPYTVSVLHDPERLVIDVQITTIQS